jgi:hypothetical protein
MREGLLQQAEAAARSITTPYQQGEALAQIVQTLRQTKDTQAAYRVAAVTCSVARWTSAAIPVLTLDPAAFTTLISMLG